MLNLAINCWKLENNPYCRITSRKLCIQLNCTAFHPAT